MSKANISVAMQLFNVPTDCEEFLFVLPGLYVGAADGNLDAEEIKGVVASAALAMNLLGTTVMDPKKLAEFLANQTVSFITRSNHNDIDTLMRGIQAKLSEYPADRANAIKGMVVASAVFVANASGALFNKVDATEANMIQRIIGYLN